MLNSSANVDTDNKNIHYTQKNNLCAFQWKKSNIKPDAFSFFVANLKINLHIIVWMQVN